MAYGKNGQTDMTGQQTDMSGGQKRTDILYLYRDVRLSVLSARQEKLVGKKKPHGRHLVRKISRNENDQDASHERDAPYYRELLSTHNFTNIIVLRRHDFSADDCVTTMYCPVIMIANRRRQAARLRRITPIPINCRRPGGRRRMPNLRPLTAIHNQRRVPTAPS